MAGTNQARRAGPRLAVVATGVVVLVALALLGFSVLGGDENGSTPEGPAPTSEAAPQPGTAGIRLTAATGPDSRNVRVQGSQFGANEEVVLSVDGKEAKRVQADSSGSFLAAVTVPFSKSSFVVRADGATSQRSASGTVTF